MTTVTLVTHDATLDTLSAADYREMFTELRQTAGSLDKFVAMVKSDYSKGQWSKFEHGDIAPTRTMRNELRNAVGMAPLPPTVTEAVGVASPDAEVWQIGTGTPERIVMLSLDNVTLHCNGAITVGDDTHETPRVTAVTGARLKRASVCRPVASLAQNERRERLQRSWREVIDAGLKALESSA